LTTAGIDALLAEVKKALGADLRKTLVQTATELGSSDGDDANETALLDRIRRALA